MTTFNGMTNNTGMSDDNFFGREPAPGVDIAKAVNDAALLAMDGLHTIIHGSANAGKLQIRIAAIKLAIVMGNQSLAETALGNAMRTVTGQASGQLDAGLDREYVHPGLADELESLKAYLRNA